jgi:hypothetical protein
MKNMTLSVTAVVLAALAFAVLPGTALAGEPRIDPASGKFPLAFSMAGGHAEFRATGEPAITCTSSSGSGQYTTATTFTIHIVWHSCSTSFFGFPVACNSAGQPSGTTTVHIAVSHNVYLTDAKTNPGVLMTPPTGGVYTTITCGGFASIEVKGNGIIGEMSAPKCGATSKTATVSFAATGASQTFKRVTATGTEYSLTATTESNGSTTTAADVGEGTITFAENATLTCV